MASRKRKAEVDNQRKLESFFCPGSASRYIWIAVKKR